MKKIIISSLIVFMSFITAFAEEKSCVSIYLSDKLDFDISASYKGVRYEFTMNHTSDPTGLLWKMNVSSFKKTTDNFIYAPDYYVSVSDNLSFNTCARYKGVLYEFTMNYTPVASDPEGLYWKIQEDSLKESDKDATLKVSNLSLNYQCFYVDGNSMGSLASLARNTFEIKSGKHTISACNRCNTKNCTTKSIDVVSGIKTVFTLY